MKIGIYWDNRHEESSLLLENLRQQSKEIHYKYTGYKFGNWTNIPFSFTIFFHKLVNRKKARYPSG